MGDSRRPPTCGNNSLFNCLNAQNRKSVTPRERNLDHLSDLLDGRIMIL